MDGQEAERRGFDETHPARLITPAAVGILAGLEEVDGQGERRGHHRVFRAHYTHRLGFCIREGCAIIGPALLRTGFLVLFYTVLVIAVTPFLIFCMVTGLRQPIVDFGLWAMRVSRRVLGIDVEVSGLDRIDPRTPFVFMPNHVSFLDGPLVMVLIPGVARVILKKSVLRIPIVGLAMRFVGFVPVDRKGTEGGKKSIARALALMRKKRYSFLIFPEGTRSRDGRLGAFRRGGFFLALESGAPIVPVTISGTRELMPKGQWFARRGTVRVVFHEPIPVAGYTTETMGVLMEKVRAAVQSGRKASTGLFNIEKQMRSVPHFLVSGLEGEDA